MWERGPLGDLEAPHTGLQGGPVASWPGGTTLWSFLRPVSFRMTADLTRSSWPQSLPMRPKIDL